MTKEVLIDFIVDYSQLENAQAILKRTGLIDSDTANSFRQTTTAVKLLSTELPGLAETFTQVKNTAKNTVMTAKEFNEAVKKSGKSVDDYINSLKKAEKGEKDFTKEIDLLKRQITSLKTEIDGLRKKKEEDKNTTVSLRQELRNLTQAIAEAKVNGKDLGAEFEAMRKRAGALKDAIGDASREIANAGSDTRNIDNFVGSITAVAGGFAAAQGAAALFGGENEDVQKALLKVNAALAISQGLQQVSNALTKEGSLVKLADVVSTGFQSAAQRIYTAVTGQSTKATLGFKAALIGTGIGAIILLVLSLASAMDFFGDETDDSKKSIEDLAESFKNADQVISQSISNMTYANRLAVANLKLRGASEAEINKKIIEGMQDEQNKNFQLYDEKKKQLDNLKKLRDQQVANDIKRGKEAGISDEEIAKKKAKSDKEFIENNKDLQESQDKSFQDFVSIMQEKEVMQKEFQLDEKKANEDAAKKRAEDAKKAAAEAREALGRRLQDELAAIELRLLKTKEGTQAEIDIQKELIQKKAEIELNAEKLGSNQIKLIKEQALKDQLDLQRKLNTKLNTQQLQTRIDNNSAELQELNISSEEKLRLTLENIQAQAQIEILAAKGNAAAIAEITAKQFADERAAKRASIEGALEEEIALNNLRTAAGRRALEQLVNDEKKSANDRITALKSIAAADIAEIDKRWLLNNSLRKSNLISEKEYTKNLLKLLDDRKKAIEALNKGIKVVNDQTADDEKAKWEFTTQMAIDTATQVAGVFAQINALSADQENQRIEGQKRQLQELIEAGAITKKEAEIREKQIEIAERQAKQRQAVREKQLAIFNAIINTAAAITKALPNIPLTIIAAAIGAAQLALIAARPIPKFAKGKKGNYAGLGEVGEAGAELVQKNGRMFLAPKRTMIYLGAQDKVFTPKETKMMLHNTDRVPTINNRNEKFDYARLGKEIANNQNAGSTVTIDKNGIVAITKNKLNEEKWFGDRFGFKL